MLYCLLRIDVLSVTGNVTFITLMLWNFSLWFLAPINVLERPCGFETNHHLLSTLYSLQWEFWGTQLTQTLHGMSQNGLSNKAVSSKEHFLTPLVLCNAHLDLYVCWCQSDNMQRSVTQYTCACSYCRSIKLRKLLNSYESVSENLRLRSNQWLIIKKWLQIGSLQVSSPDCSRVCPQL